MNPHINTGNQHNQSYPNYEFWLQAMKKQFENIRGLNHKESINMDSQRQLFLMQQSTLNSASSNMVSEQAPPSNEISSQSRVQQTSSTPNPNLRQTNSKDPNEPFVSDINFDWINTISDANTRKNTNNVGGSTWQEQRNNHRLSSYPQLEAAFQLMMRAHQQSQYPSCSSKPNDTNKSANESSYSTTPLIYLSSSQSNVNEYNNNSVMETLRRYVSLSHAHLQTTSSSSAINHNVGMNINHATKDSMGERLNNTAWSCDISDVETLVKPESYNHHALEQPLLSKSNDRIDLRQQESKFANDNEISTRYSASACVNDCLLVDRRINHKNLSQSNICGEHRSRIEDTLQAHSSSAQSYFHSNDMIRQTFSSTQGHLSINNLADVLDNQRSDPQNHDNLCEVDRASERSDKRHSLSNSIQESDDAHSPKSEDISTNEMLAGRNFTLASSSLCRVSTGYATKEKDNCDIFNHEKATGRESHKTDDSEEQSFHSPLSLPEINNNGSNINRVRTAYSSIQILNLEHEFSANMYLSRIRRIQLAQKLKLSEKQVKIWFQNRRVKHKKESSQGGGDRFNRYRQLRTNVEPAFPRDCCADPS